MRYSIQKITTDQVKVVGGINVKEMLGGKVIYADLSDEQKIKLETMGAIISEVRQIRPMVFPPPVPVQAQPIYTAQGLTQLTGFEKARNITTPPLYGEGISVAIIGTGIRESHQLINNRVVYSKNYTTTPMRDGFNHDTGVCSIILAVAPQCNILNLKVMDDSGNGTEEEVILAIDDCIDLQDKRPDIAPSVINMSFGAPDTNDSNDVMRLACRAAIAKGIWVCAAAGNSGPSPGTIMTPACEKYVFAVGSCKLVSISQDSYTFAVSDFSSRGPTKEGLIKPEVVFIGEDIEMASSVSDIATIAKSGTSFSTPFCTGIAVLYQQGVIVIDEAYGRRLATEYLERMPISEFVAGLIRIEQLIDRWGQYIAIRPVGVASGKDNDYGYGLPFADMVVKTLGIIPTTDITSVFSPLLSMMFIFPFFGMVSKMFTKKQEEIKG